MFRVNAIALWGAAFLAIYAQGGSAAAQDASQPAASNNGNGDFGEIVVTARRREEKLQTIPLAVTAFTQASIEQKRIHEIHDLGQYVPSLGVLTSESDTNAPYAASITLRGLQGTQIYFADVPIYRQDSGGATRGLSDGNFYDLEDLEVIKGPQGTLFGKNSIGGLISIQPKRPTDNFEGYLRTGFGNYSDKEVEGAVNIPVIADKLMVRVAGQMQQRDGYTKNLTTGRDLDNKSYYGWRVSVTFKPTDDIENYLVYDGYWQDTNGTSDIVTYLNPDFIIAKLDSSFNPLPPGSDNGCFAIVTLQTGNGVAGVPGGCGKIRFGAYSQDLKALLAQQQALGPRAVKGNNFQDIGKDYFYGITDIATWSINDELSIKNIAAVRVSKQLATIDYSPFGAPILTIGAPGNNQNWFSSDTQYTEELQLQGKALSDRLNWIAGGYLEFDHPGGDSERVSGALRESLAESTSYAHPRNTSRSQALFAHGDYSLDDWVSGLKFTAGYRYTWDFLSQSQRGTSGADAVTRDSKGLPTNCTGAFLVDTNCFQSAPDAHFSSYGWNLALEEQLTPNTLLYVRSGNAYRPGGSILQVPAQYALYQPEHVTDVEIGAKAEWDLFGMHARTNADIFHTDYKAIQVQSLVSFTNGAGQASVNNLTLNAASATVQGGEFEGDFAVFKGFEISPHFSYVDAKYDNYPTKFNPSGTSTPFIYFPKLQYGLTGTYHLPIDEAYGDVALSVNYSWYGHQYESQSVGEIYNIDKSYDLVNIRVDWTNMFGRPYDLGLFVSNATDNLYVTGGVPVYTQLGFSSLGYSAPRMYGVTFKMRFGPGLNTGLGL